MVPPVSPPIDTATLPAISSVRLSLELLHNSSLPRVSGDRAQLLNHIPKILSNPSNVIPNICHLFVYLHLPVVVVVVYNEDCCSVNVCYYMIHCTYSRDIYSTQQDPSRLHMAQGRKTQCSSKATRMLVVLHKYVEISDPFVSQPVVNSKIGSKVDF